MVNYKYEELLRSSSVDRQLKITFQDGSVIENVDCEGESLELCERLCSSEQLRFGSCEASTFKINIVNKKTALSGKGIAVHIIAEGGETQEFELGHYTIYSDKPTANYEYREVIAYDDMYNIVNADVATWYNSIFTEEVTEMTLKEFRDSFLAHFGIEQEEIELVNDSMTVTKTIEPSKLSGKTVITAICEINGCFGHIGRDGKFQYIFLRDLDLYPSDTLYPEDDLFPGQPNEAEEVSRSHYISAKYEDYETELIDKLQIRQEEDDIGYIYGDGNNCYIVQDNFLVYGKAAEELYTIAENLFFIIGGVWYRPAHVEAKGNPCLEVGDGIKLETSTGTMIYTYLLQRTLKGIQALWDTYNAEGEQFQNEKVNSTREQIIQLKGKTNKITRTLEETKSEIVDMERNLSSQIKQNAEQILLRVSKGSIISEINQTAEKITISAQKIDLKGLVEANEFVSKYATIESLNTINLAVSGKLDAKDFTAEKISAMEITVKAANITGELTANKISAASITISDSVIPISWQKIYTLGQVMEVEKSTQGYITRIVFKKHAIYTLGYPVRSVGEEQAGYDTDYPDPIL